MKDEEITTLLEAGETIDHKWEPYALEHVNQSQKSFKEQETILQEIHSIDEESTRPLLRSIICDLDHFREEEQNEFSHAVKRAVDATKSVILDIYQRTRECVLEFEMSVLEEGRDFMKTLSHSGDDISSPHLRQQKMCPPNELYAACQELNEYNSMFWDLRIKKIIDMISSKETDLSSLCFKASEEMSSINISCAEYESQIAKAKSSIDSKQEYLQKIVEDIKDMECTKDIVEQEHHHLLQEAAMIQGKCIARQASHQRQLEDISFETTTVMRELKRIVVHFERMAGLHNNHNQD